MSNVESIFTTTNPPSMAGMGFWLKLKTPESYVFQGFC
jgi:hypothetical protein